jgi:hypothetical protein
MTPPNPPISISNSQNTVKIQNCNFFALKNPYRSGQNSLADKVLEILPKVESLFTDEGSEAGDGDRGEWKDGLGAEERIMGRIKKSLN